jgi:hypothetical protein
MRDIVAAFIALALVFFALGLATTLTAYRRRLRQRYAAERALGRAIIAELPVGSELRLFTEDDDAFLYGPQSIAKDRLTAVRVLINGVPIASYVSTRWPRSAAPPPTAFEDRPEGIARDRWDVALETADGVTLVECGAIRERVSQELARQVYDAVHRDLERRDAATTALR